jgi:hypothetical protein
MRHRIALIFTLSAWLLATGSQWDAVQTFAWGRMIVGYAQDMPIAAAVKKTFSPETMCELCHAVAAAKKSQEHDAALPGAKSVSKVVLVFAPDRSSYLSPSMKCVGIVQRMLPPTSAERAEPSSPPPRSLA